MLVYNPGPWFRRIRGYVDKNRDGYIRKKDGDHGGLILTQGGDSPFLLLRTGKLYGPDMRQGGMGGQSLLNMRPQMATYFTLYMLTWMKVSKMKCQQLGQP